MVKGVHRKAIEILQPEDPCFERAIFFLSPRGELDEKVQLRARDYLRRAGVRPTRACLALSGRDVIVTSTPGYQEIGGGDQILWDDVP